MAIQDIYESGGLVTIQDDKLPEVQITWRQAIERCHALKSAEMRVSSKYDRTTNIQKLVEKMILAAVAARKKTEPDWKPPSSLLGFSLKKASSIVIPR